MQFRGRGQVKNGGTRQGTGTNICSHLRYTVVSRIIRTLDFTIEISLGESPLIAYWGSTNIWSVIRYSTLACKFFFQLGTIRYSEENLQLNKSFAEYQWEQKSLICWCGLLRLWEFRVTASSQRHTLPICGYMHPISEVIILNNDQHQHQKIISTSNRINWRIRRQHTTVVNWFYCLR